MRVRAPCERGPRQRTRTCTIPDPEHDRTIVAVVDRGEEDLSVTVLTPPDLRYASGAIALDGTPNAEMWETALGIELETRAVLDTSEREDYVRDTLGLRIIRTSEAVKPYSNPDNVTDLWDGALLRAIAEQHGDTPDVISSRAALRAYEESDFVDSSTFGDTTYYGNLKGSNRFASSRLGAVIGSMHYGDDYVKKWAAYVGVAAEASRDVESNEGFGVDLSYGDVGDRILHQMREAQTAQAVMRFGRDGGGATVYVHTNTLPEWMPVVGVGEIVRTRSEGERAVLRACRDLAEDDSDGWARADVETHPDVDLSTRQVNSHLSRLADEGVLIRRRGGRGYRYTDNDLANENADAKVDLPTADLEEVRRDTNYTWDFQVTTSSDDPTSPSSETDGTSSKTTLEGGLVVALGVDESSVDAPIRVCLSDGHQRSPEEYVMCPSDMDKGLSSAG